MADLNRQEKDKLWQLLNQKEHVSKPIITVCLVLILGGLLSIYGWNKVSEFRQKEWVLAISPLTRWCHDHRDGFLAQVPNAATVDRVQLRHLSHECACLTDPVFRLKMISSVQTGWRAHYDALLKRSDFVQRRVDALEEGWKVLLPAGDILEIGFNDPDRKAEQAILSWLAMRQELRKSGKEMQQRSLEIPVLDKAALRQVCPKLK